MVSDFHVMRLHIITKPEALLHRDISIGNILIAGGRGILIDCAITLCPHCTSSDYEFGRLLSCEGDDEAARQQFDLVLSEKSMTEGWIVCKLNKMFCASLLLQDTCQC